MSSQETLDQHLKSGRFLAGVASGRWRVVGSQFPHLFIEITARDGRKVTLRFTCADYPAQPPTAAPWDMGSNGLLAAAKWPKGGRVTQVFNPGWKGGTALYIPCDRQSIEGHPNWHNEYPWLIWQPAKGLIQYIEAVFEILQSNELVAQPA